MLQLLSHLLQQKQQGWEGMVRQRGLTQWLLQLRRGMCWCRTSRSATAAAGTLGSGGMKEGTMVIEGGGVAAVMVGPGVMRAVGTSRNVTTTQVSRSRVGAVLLLLKLRTRVHI